MTLASELPRDLTPARRLREYVRTVRELSRARDPNELILSYRRRSQFIVPSTHALSLSRRDLPRGKVRITRCTRWREPVNPWQEPEKLPVIDRGMLVRIAEAGRPIKIDRLEVPPDDPFAAYAEGMRSLLAAPGFHEGEPLYTTILLHEREAAYTLDDLATFVLTTNLIGRATSELVVAQQLRQAYARLHREFETIGQIQRHMLPAAPPRIPGVTIATFHETAEQAGGDYYDFFELADGRFGIMIADVSGHGAAAAVVVAMLHAFMRAPLRACPGATSPAEIVRELNRELHRSIPLHQFVTAFLATYDPRSRIIHYVNAGHNPPRLLPAGQSEPVPLIGRSTLPLAIEEPYQVIENTLQVRPQDRLLLYTDGVTESFNEQREIFGTQRLDALLRDAGADPQTLIERIVAALRAFSPDRPPADDRTLIAIEFHDATQS